MPVYLQIRQPPVGERMGADSTKEMTLIIKKAADDWAFAKACSEDLKTTHDVSAILAVALDALAQIGKQGVGKILDWMETVLTENVKKCEDLRAYVTDRDWDNLKKKWEEKQAIAGYLSGMGKTSGVMEDIFAILSKLRRTLQSSEALDTCRRLWGGS